MEKQSTPTICSARQRFSVDDVIDSECDDISTRDMLNKTAHPEGGLLAEFKVIYAGIRKEIAQYQPRNQNIMRI